MKALFRGMVLVTADLSYRLLLRPLIFLMSAQSAHNMTLRLLAWLDGNAIMLWLLRRIHHLTYRQHNISIGGVTLPHPFIVAAGLVKGLGFATETDAMNAVQAGRNIIPGWRTVPTLTGLVEMGSFTRYPRLGNPGIVVWRNPKTRSIQNRIGLKNPGVYAAAAFLAKHRAHLPAQFGINIAVSPGVDDPQQQIEDIIVCLSAFIDAKVIPTWFTLNISCPNTEDDPGGNQTEALTHQLCSAAVNCLRESGLNTPLWVKVSPDLADEQYQTLIRVFHEVGVRAVIATNTLPQPTPDNTNQMAGVGGGELHPQALAAVTRLKHAQVANNYAVDVIGCGGVMGGHTYAAYVNLGVPVVQYWSALIYRGPLAAALIEREWTQTYAPNT